MNDLCIMLLGNKRDKVKDIGDERRKEIRDFCRKRSVYEFVMVSAKTGEGVKEAFRQMGIYLTGKNGNEGKGREEGIGERSMSESFKIEVNEKKKNVNSKYEKMAGCCV